jgi:radical SAM enzyme (TIGR01210 family)
MRKADLIQQLLKRSKKAKKTYSFDDDHDEHRPIEMWFQESDEGLVLFVVFYSLACRWSQCLGCNLPSKAAGRHIPFRSIVKQVEYLFNQPEVQAKKGKIRKVIVSNNGSILDQETFSSAALMYFLVQLKLQFPRLGVMSIESRPEYIEITELEFLARALAEGDTPTTLEIAVGFEALSDRIRYDVFLKGLSLASFEKLAGEVAPYGFHLKCYFMLKPVPGLSDEEAKEDIREAIDYLSDIARRYSVAINMHLNPTFVAKGTVLEEAFRSGVYTPPRLRDVAETVLRARDRPISVFIGLSDEGLAVEGGSFLRPGEEAAVRELEEFNRTQDYGILDRMLARR